MINGDLCATHVDGMRQSALEQLARTMAVETDAILREAVTRFLGRDTWTLDELKGRGVMQRLSSGIEIFVIDDVALVELHPITLENKHKDWNTMQPATLPATRQYRFLLPRKESDMEQHHRSLRIDGMNPPEFTKPFNLEHAKAGAPYSCKDGTEATVLKWDGRLMGCSLVGVYGPNDKVMTWAADGSYGSSRHDHIDLVMLPIGLIDGKPVFVGDEYTDPLGNLRSASPSDRYYTCCTWPEPAKIYPISSALPCALKGAFNSHWKKGGSMDESILYLASTAIRHAIDTGQVITRADHEAALVKIGNEIKVLTFAQYDRAVRALDRAGFEDRGGKDWVPPVGPAPKFIPATDAKREVEIVNATRAWYEQKFPYIAHAHPKPDVLEIIAGVAP